jgi:hypothetical protein
MSQPSVCLNRKFLIRNATVDQVVVEANRALQEIGLKIKNESVVDGKTSIFAAEGALAPITMKILTYPLWWSEFLRSAQRSGVHILIAPGAEGVYFYVCGISLVNLRGRPEKYSEVTIEEVTDTLKSLDFEEKFIKTVISVFPQTEELDPFK